MEQKDGDKEIKQFLHGEIIPESIHHAITLHTSHIYQMVIAYSRLCMIAKENGTGNGITKSNEFETLIKNAFDGINSITSIGFIDYVEKFILETTDNLILQKAYNFISEKLNDLSLQPTKLRFNPIYPHYNSLFETTSSKMILYLLPLGHEEDVNGNYKEVKGSFTANDLFDAIIQDLEKTKYKIDSLFTLKKLNEKQNTFQSNAASKQPARENELIKWNGKNKNDLAYLLWKLQKDNIISINDFGLTLSKIFIDSEGNAIKNTLFNKYSSEFNKNQFPANANEIDKLIAILKKGID